MCTVHATTEPVAVARKSPKHGAMDEHHASILVSAPPRKAEPMAVVCHGNGITISGRGCSVLGDDDRRPLGTTS